MASSPDTAGGPETGLSEADIRAACGDTYFGRGQEYFHEDRVEIAEAAHDPDDDCLFVEAFAHGNRKRPYNQRIELWPEGDGYWIEGDCSCPVGHNCKHVAAVLLLAREEPGLIPATLGGPATPEEWIEQLKASTTPMNREGSAAVEADTGLRYLLSPARQPDGTPTLQVALDGYVNSPGGRLSPMRFPSVDVLQRLGYLADRDREIAPLLAGCSPTAQSGDFRLNGPAGSVALDRMLATGRCHWESTRSPPLAVGGPRPVHTRWEQDEIGQYHLVVAADPPADHLAPLDPPVYVDPERGECGQLEWQGEAASLAALLGAPPVPAEAAEEFSTRLAAEVPAAPVEPPAPVETEEIAGVEPVPRLTLLAAVDGDDEPVHLARLAFDYAGHEVSALPPEPVSARREQGRVVRIHRRREAEDTAVSQLTAAGFVTAAAALQQEGYGPVLAMGAATPVQSVRNWDRFLEEEIPALRAEGWEVEIDPNFRLGITAPDQWQLDVAGGEGDWLGVGLGIRVGGERLDLLPLLEPLIQRLDRPETLLDWQEDLYLPVAGSQWLRLSAEAVYPVVRTLFELFDRPRDEAGRIPMSRIEGLRLSELEASAAPVDWVDDSGLRSLAEGLGREGGIPTVQPPAGLAAELRPYQQRGLEWLQFLACHGLGGVLADDMGLGKTIQAMAHLLKEREQGRLDRPTLVVAPTSLLSNWRAEIRRFVPGLSVLTLHGPQRGRWYGSIGAFDVVLTTYALLPRDGEALREWSYHAVILDEAQTIKNPNTKAAVAARSLTARQRLALTGTPMENHLGELWSLFHFLLPGLLGDQKQFRRLFRTPIEREGDTQRHATLQARVRPFLLRRTKHQVAAELPEKTEVVQTVGLGAAQADFYETIRLAMEKRVRDAVADKGLARSQVTVLDALLKLRQACCDPRLVKLEGAKQVRQSAKLELLMEMLPEMVEEGRRILLFSQFTSMLGLIEAELKKAGIAHSKLTGQTKKRDAAIERFRFGQAPVFLISLKAGGVGLNLTEADTVIHYDPWWNPAVEDQATDRAHRIGQDQGVFVYKLITEGTVEQRIVAMQERKGALAEAVYGREGKAEETAPRLTEADLEELLKPLE